MKLSIERITPYLSPEQGITEEEARGIAALAPPANSLDEISSKDYGADGVGLTHAEVDKLAEEDK